METQHRLILHHLRTVGALTRLDALLIYGIGNITARITELRRAGYNIVTTMIPNKPPKRSKHARYTILESANPPKP